MDTDLRVLRDLLRSLGMESAAAEQLLASMVPVAGDDQDTPLYPISLAARLAGMHPQTLRQYDRMGLVVPSRTKGRGRRYSPADVERLCAVQRLSQEGVSLAGIAQVLDLDRQNQQLRREVRALREALAVLAQQKTRVFAADPTGGVTPYQRGSRPGKVRPAHGGQLIRRSIMSADLVLWGNSANN